MKRIALGVAPILLAALLLGGCSKNSPTAPSTLQTLGKVSFAIDASGDPAANIVSGKITITKGSLVQTQSVTVAKHTGTVTFANVQIGKWDISAQLFDSDGTEIYSGQGTANVAKDQTAIAKIKVNHNTGNLQIIVELPENTMEGLMFWNKMGSLDEIQNSAYGPGLTVYDPTDPYYLFSNCILANPGFIPGVFGNATTIASLAPYTDPNPCSCAFDLNNVSQILNPERGTIEFWYKQNGNPAYGESGALYPVNNNDISINSYVPNSFYFLLGFGKPWAVIETDISAYNYTWIHIAAVWDRAGIQGSGDAMRLYVNGTIIAVNASNNWGTTITQHKLGVMAGVNAGVAGKWGMDNLKIYNYAKTDFSDRNHE